jgi:acyl-CoA synthetase (AMP-forming)/AMP-acid ligase II
VSDLPATLGEAFRQAAANVADTTFVVTPTARLSYADIERMSIALAGRLLASGVGKGTRVGLLFTYGHEWVVGWAAITRIGALAMPLSSLSTPTELESLIRRCDLHTLISASSILGHSTTDALSAALGLADVATPELRLETAPYLRQILVVGADVPPWATALDLDGPIGESALVRAAERRVDAGDAATVVHTSGSTAEPKGVVHTHGSVLRSCVPICAEMLASSPGSTPKVLCAMPFFWVGGILTVGSALLAGATLIMMDRFEPGAALELVEREQATYLMGWSTVTQNMRAHPDFVRRDLTSMPRLVNGPAEIALIDVPDPGVPRHRGMSETMGTFAATEMKIVDVVSRQELPEGEHGELLVRGPGVMSGYYNRERHEVFDADGWYATGDRCYVREGYEQPFYVGRFTEMVKTAGANVAPREVELAVESLAEVKHCIVLGVASEQRGEEVAAVVVMESGHPFDETAMRERLRAVLAPYKIPTQWHAVEPEQLIWLGSGKPDKNTLRRLFFADIQQNRMSHS